MAVPLRALLLLLAVARAAPADAPPTEAPAVEVTSPAPAPPRGEAEPEPDPVMVVVRRGADDLKRCYERLLRGERLRGRVVVEITVEGGTPTATAVVEDTVGDELLTGCLQETMRRWRFPADVDDTVQVPLVFADE